MKVHVLPAAEWTERVTGELVQRVQVAPALRVCLASGGTPAPVYRRLVALGTDLSELQVLALDEFGGVPVGVTGTCADMLHADLIEPGRITEYRPLRPEHDPIGEECAGIDAWIDRGGIDLAILGIGVNGHVGMNEPGASWSDRTHRVDLAPSTSERSRRYFSEPFAPTWGITVGLGDLLAAREVWIVATGGEKTEIVGRLLTTEPDAALPATAFLDHPNATVWADDLAIGARAP